MSSYQITNLQSNKNSILKFCCCHELMEKIKIHEGKKYLMVDDYPLDKDDADLQLKQMINCQIILP